jgi:putative FmdB family regulatory protein
MPTYDYGCTVCGRMVEVMHGVHGTGPEKCEVCGGVLRKLISAAAVHYKGSGWAAKDARDSGRARTTAGTATESKTTTDGSTTDAGKTSTDGAKSSGDAASSSPAPAPAAESKAKAAPATSGAGDAA